MLRISIINRSRAKELTFTTPGWLLVLDSVDDCDDDCDDDDDDDDDAADDDDDDDDYDLWWP